MRTRSALAVLVLLGAFSLSGAPAAQALSCVGPERLLDQAPIVFTATITGAENERIRVAVKEIWKGSAVPEEVWLRTQLVGFSEWAGPDRKIADGYTSADTWIFAPDLAADGTMTVNPCSAWRADEPYIDRFRPATVTAPAAAPRAAHLTRTDAWTLIGTGAGAALVLALILVSGRRRARGGA